MPITRVIIIFGQAASPVGGFIFLIFLAFAVVSLLEFLEDGDSVPGTINTIQGRTACWPTVNAFNATVAAAKKMDAEGKTKGMTRADHEAYGTKHGGAIWLDEGTDVKVLVTPFLKPVRGVEAWWQLRLIELTDGSKRSCYVNVQTLEMGFFEWIKWKLN